MDTAFDADLLAPRRWTSPAMPLAHRPAMLIAPS